VAEDISPGFTMLRTDDGRSLIIANGTMTQQTLIRMPLATSASHTAAKTEAPN